MSSQRFSGFSAAYGTRSAAAAGTKTAAEAAVACLKSGGNVVDAAIAASAVLTVMLPNANSLGGDLLALVKFRQKPILAVNATGAAPRGASIEAYQALGHSFVPEAGGLAVQGPGLVAGWQTLHDRWGTRPMTELLAPAVALARDGFPVGWRVAAGAQRHREKFSALPGWTPLFAPGGKPITEGETLYQPALARSLQTIGERGARGFYEGPIARDIARSVQSAGGFLAEEDLAAIRAEVLPVLTTRYRGLEISTQPPITQGVVLLRALRLLEQMAPDPRRLGSGEFWTLAARALRRAFDERLAILGDGPEARAHAEAMIDGRAAELDLPKFEFAATADNTTKVSVMDREGNAVACIQSVYAEFGSGVVAPESGILMNNRMIAFFLDPERANALVPGRRTMHRLHTFMAADADGIKWIGGSPGGDNQPQVNLQVLSHLIDFGMPPEEAVAAPRWSLVPGTKPRDIAKDTPAIDCETGVADAVKQGFAAAGFAPRDNPNHRSGSSKIVGLHLPRGPLGAFADWRREGDVAAD